MTLLWRGGAGRPRIWPGLRREGLAREEEALERCLEVAAGEISYRQWMCWMLLRLPASLLKAVEARVL